MLQIWQHAARTISSVSVIILRPSDDDIVDL